MRIAVLGGWRQEDARTWNLRESPEHFAQACRRIGQELIERGHSLIVGTDSLHMGDPSRRQAPATIQRAGAQGSA